MDVMAKNYFLHYFFKNGWGGRCRRRRWGGRGRRRGRRRCRCSSSNIVRWGHQRLQRVRRLDEVQEGGDDPNHLPSADVGAPK